MEPRNKALSKQGLIFNQSTINLLRERYSHSIVAGGLPEMS